PFGTDEHFELWAPRAEQLRGRLVELELFDKTLVLQVPWALVTVDGKHTPQSMGTTAMEANEAYRRYYEHLRGLGFRILELQPLGVLADPEHRWGLAPFHYTQDVYEEIVGRILADLPAKVTGEAACAPAPAAPTRAEGSWSRAGEGGAASALSERRPPVFEGRGQRALEGLDGGGDVGVGMGGGDVPATTGQGEDAAAQQLDQQPVVEGL